MFQYPSLSQIWKKNTLKIQELATSYLYLTFKDPFLSNLQMFHSSETLYTSCRPKNAYSAQPK